MLTIALFLIEKKREKYKLPLVEKCLINFWSIVIVKNYHPIHLTQDSRRKEKGTDRKGKSLKGYG